MKITAIEPGSTGESLGLKIGADVEAIDGRRVKDIIDYRFKISAEKVLLRVRKNGQLQEFDIEKDYDDNLGLEFADFKIRSCANDCIFCFVDQNPKNMRKALYFRDGDFRMSFLHGHYITMTNMGWKEMERVVEQRLSPLYISVHVTDPERRKQMFLYGKDDFFLDKFKYLTENGIELHSQIVLCPTWNDGNYLWKTVADIHQFLPAAKSLAIVPVGLTGHRDGLTKIPLVTKAYARNFLKELEKLDAKYKQEDGSRFIFPSDEWFLKLGNTLPDLKFYENIALDENGVGQVPLFMERWTKGMSALKPSFKSPRKITIGSGVLISSYFREKFIPMLERVPGLEVNYSPIKNKFMGADNVTVTGLLTGQDIVEQLKGRDLGDAVIFSDRIIREAGDVTLDDMSIEDITDQLGTPFKITGDEPVDFFKLIEEL
ncbi:MAG: DUF512 domain-containing protein [Candidatus Neomarinimicrobiota bacterium]